MVTLCDLPAHTELLIDWGYETLAMMQLLRLQKTAFRSHQLHIWALELQQTCNQYNLQHLYRDQPEEFDDEEEKINSQDEEEEMEVDLTNNKRETSSSTFKPNSHVLLHDKFTERKTPSLSSSQLPAVKSVNITSFILDDSPTTVHSDSDLLHASSPDHSSLHSHRTSNSIVNSSISAPPPVAIHHPVFDPSLLPAQPSLPDFDDSAPHLNFPDNPDEYTFLPVKSQIAFKNTARKCIRESDYSKLSQTTKQQLMSAYQKTGGARVKSDRSVVGQCIEGHLNKCSVYEVLNTYHPVRFLTPPDQPCYAVLATDVIREHEGIGLYLGSFEEADRFVEKGAQDDNYLVRQVYAYDLVGSQLHSSYIGPDLIVESLIFGNETRFINDAFCRSVPVEEAVNAQAQVVWLAPGEKRN